MKNRFATRLGIYRDFSGETQQQLADSIGVTVRALRAWEQGINSCSFDHLIAICDHYQISADWILGINPDDNPVAARSQSDLLTFHERHSLTLYEEYLLSKHRKR